VFFGVLLNMVENTFKAGTATADQFEVGQDV
jgi:hypothetical protein